MNGGLAALYARVSSDQQALTGTIQSQLAALRAYVAERGWVIPPAREFVDDGSGPPRGDQVRLVQHGGEDKHLNGGQLSVR